MNVIYTVEGDYFTIVDLKTGIEYMFHRLDMSMTIDRNHNNVDMLAYNAPESLDLWAGLADHLQGIDRLRTKMLDFAGLLCSKCCRS